MSRVHLACGGRVDVGGRDLQVEQFAERLRICFAAWLGGQLPDPDGRLVEQALDDPVDAVGDLGAVAVGIPCVIGGSASQGLLSFWQKNQQ